jgi:iron(III) transport system substrate-binding protein
MAQPLKNPLFRPRARRGVVVVAVLVATSSFLTACGSGAAEEAESGPPQFVSQADWDTVVDGAKEEGEVVVYSSLSDTEATFAEFKKMYPEIDVRIERAPTAELITRLDQEIEANAEGADVTLNSETAWFEKRYDDDEFAAIKVSPDLKKTGWEEWLEGKSIPFIFANAYVLGYNTKTAKPVENMGDFIPAAEGKKVGLIDPNITPAQTFLYSEWQEAYGDDIMKKLSETDHSIFSSNVPLAQGLAAGELDYGVGLAPSTIASLKQEGAPVDYVVPQEANAGVPYHAAGVARAPQSPSAHLLGNWMMSEDGAKVFAKNHHPAWTPIEVEGSVPRSQLSIAEEAGWSLEKDEAFIKGVWSPLFD